MISAVAACCILHNTCEERGHQGFPEEPEEVRSVQGDREPPGRRLDNVNVREGEKVMAALMSWIRRHARR